MHPSQNYPRTGRFRRLLGGVAIVGALAVAGSIATGHYFRAAQATATAAAAEQAVPVTVALIEPKQTVLWDEFSGRLEAVERVEVRSRVAGAVQSVHFREGALVKAGDLLVTIDPAPYAAEVDARAGAGRGRAGARRAHQERARARRSSLSDKPSSRSATRPARQRLSRGRRQSARGRRRRCRPPS